MTDKNLPKVVTQATPDEPRSRPVLALVNEIQAELKKPDPVPVGYAVIDSQGVVSLFPNFESASNWLTYSAAVQLPATIKPLLLGETTI